MFTDNVLEATPMTSTLRRRGVGKAIWRRMIEELIASERMDLDDLRMLRNRLINDPQSIKLIAQLQERKTERICQLNDLLHYRDSSKDEQ